MGSDNGKKGSPVVMGPTQPQDQHQDQCHHAGGRHRDVPLPPVAGVAQLPPQVSVLAAVPDEAYGAPVTTHRQGQPAALAQNASVFQAQYTAICISRLSSLEAYGKSIRGQLKALCFTSNAARTSTFGCLPWD